MGFTPDQTAKRHAVIIEREAAHQARDAKDRARQELEQRLTYEYPQLNVRIAMRLWHIAVQLTDALIRQYEDGADELVVSSSASRGLFEGLAKFTTEGGWSSMTYKDNGNGSLLQPMARSYNDIGQTFEVGADNSHSSFCGGSGTDLQMIVTCRAPLPEE